MRKIITNKRPRRTITSVIPKTITLVILSILITDLVFSQQKTRTWRGREGKVMEYELVKEQNLGKDIRKVIYSKKTYTDPMKPKYIRRHFITKDGRKLPGELVALNKGKAIPNISPKDRITFTESGNFYYRKKVLERIEKGPMKIRVSFFQAPDKILWEKDYIIGYDAGGPGYIISDFDGTVVEIVGKLYFYSSSGDFLNSHKLYNTKISYREGGITGRFTENGQYFVSQVTGDDGSTYSHGTAIILFTKDGEKLWTFEPFEPKGFYTIWPSLDASFIISFNFILGKEEATYLLDRKGNLIQRFLGLYTSHAVFSESQEYAVLNNINEVNLIRCQTGEIAMHYPHWGRGPNILDIDISEELGVVAILEGSISGQTVNNPLAKFTNGKISVINLNGVPAWEHYLPIIEAPQIATKLSLSRDGKTIGVMLASTYSEYKLQE